MITYKLESNRKVSKREREGQLDRYGVMGNINEEGEQERENEIERRVGQRERE